MQFIQKDGKTFAKISDLMSWPKNPKFIKEENLDKLKNQIKELGLYKPLVCTPDGCILGGNQRFRALKELGIEEAWVSIVNAWDDQTRLKYALSDNLSLGTYKKDELYELVKPMADQPSLFKDYDIEISDVKSLQQFAEDFLIGEDQLKLLAIKAQLREAGINPETIEIIEQMSKYNKSENTVEDVDIQGCQTKERYPLLFWVDNKETYDKLFAYFSPKGGQRLDTELLIKLVENL